MVLTRRDFGKYLGTGTLVVLAGGSTLALDGCNIAEDIINWEPTAISALTGIVDILTGNGIIFSPAVTLALTAVKAVLADMVGAAQEYLSTTPPPVGALQKLKTILQDVVDNFGTFLTALDLPGGGLWSLVTGLVQLILGTIAGFMGKLPAVASSAKVMFGGVRVGSVILKINPVKNPTKRGFKKSWNKVLDTSSGVVVPASAWCKLSLLDHLPNM